MCRLLPHPIGLSLCGWWMGFNNIKTIARQRQSALLTNGFVIWFVWVAHSHIWRLGDRKLFTGPLFSCHFAVGTCLSHVKSSSAEKLSLFCFFLPQYIFVACGGRAPPSRYGNTMTSFYVALESGSWRPPLSYSCARPSHWQELREWHYSPVTHLQWEIRFLPGTASSKTANNLWKRSLWILQIGQRVGHKAQGKRTSHFSSRT